jgi:hypothetical protein
MTEAEWLNALGVTEVKVLIGVVRPTGRSKKPPRAEVSARIETPWGQAVGEGASLRDAVIDVLRRALWSADQLAREAADPDLRAAWSARARGIRAAWRAAGEKGEP